MQLERLEGRDVPAAYTWDGGGLTDNWSDDANWVSDVGPDGTTTDDLTFPGGAGRLTNINDIAGQTVNTLTFTGGNYTISGNPLTLVGTTGAVTVTSSAANNVLTLDIVLGAAAGASQEFAVAGGGGPSGSLELDGVISGATGAAVLKTGGGNLKFGGAAANTYTGATVAAEGFLFLGKTGGVAIPAGGLSVTETGFVRYQAHDQIADTAPVLVSSGFGLDLNTFNDTIGPLTLGDTGGTGGVVQTGPAIGPGTLRLNGDITRTLGAGSAQIFGKIDLNGATRTVTVPEDGVAPNAELIITAQIVGTGGLTKAGAGGLLLNGTSLNTYTGTTTVVDGTLGLNRTGTGAPAIPGNLVIGDGAGADDVQSFAPNQVADGATVTLNAGAVWGVNSQPDAIAALTVNGGTVNIGAGGGALTVGGAVTLTGATITGGTTSPLVLGAGLTTLASAATTTISAPVSLNGATRTFDVADGAAADDLSVAGVISGAGVGLTKTGAGRLALNAVNTYSGPTTVNAGSLRVVGSITNSAVTLNGGTVGGGGAVGPLTTTAGTVAPGLANPPVSLATGNLTLSPGTTLTTSITDTAGGVADVLTVTGTVNLNGAAFNPVVVGANPTGSRSFLLVFNDGTDPVVGTFAGLPQGATVTIGGVAFTISYAGADGSGNDVVLVPVSGGSSPPPPPPGTSPPPPLVPGGPGPLAVGGATNGSARVYNPDAGGTFGTTPAATLSPFGSIAADVRVATGDIDGDQFRDIIMVTGPGVPLRLAVISGKDNSTVLVAPFDPLGGNFTGGAFVTAADFDKDGRAEVVVTPDQGGGPRVVIFSLPAVGALAQRASFFGIDDPNFRGGARAGAGDLNKDGTPDLAVAAGFGGGPRVVVFDGTAVFGTRTKLVNDFFVFEDTLRNGAYVALGDVDGDGFADLLAGAGPGGAPRLLTLSGQKLLTQGPAAAIAAPLSNFFVANNSGDRGGVRVAAITADSDARADVAVGSGEGSPSRVRVYLGKNFGGSEPPVFQDLDPFGGGTLADGVFVG